MNILSNAFSLQMLSAFPAVPIIEECTIEEIKNLLEKGDMTSTIGHQDIANILSDMTGCEVPVNRVSNKIEADDFLYVAQLIGGRLPEGCTTLPENFTLKFLRIRVLYSDRLCIHADGTICQGVTPCYCNCDALG